ncbi:hypothetical protein ACJVDH_11465 [Pedobacter sp. AW1-32]|uniref:hypothetical protein n=1 Tax=Pedobacter sp. AW1-32 TaxID=3383026 RepID=UPI003FF04871
MKLTKTLSQAQVLTRSQLKNVLGGLQELSVEGGMPCDKVVCKAEDWCCDTTGVCRSRNPNGC